MIGIQYYSDTGIIKATVRPPLADMSILPGDVGQLIVPDGTATDGKMLDVTQDPPVLVDAPSD